MAKKTKIEKVSKESGIEEADLARLPMDAIDKIDQLVDDEEIDEDDLLNSGEWEEKVPDQSAKIFVGYHPITKEPVYI